MLELATAAASAGFLVTVSMVLFSCAACRRFLEKRQKKEDSKQERINIPEIKIDIGEDKIENGILNPGYQEAENDVTKTQVREQKDGQSSDVTDSTKAVKEDESKAEPQDTQIVVKDVIPSMEESQETHKPPDSQQTDECKKESEQGNGVDNNAYEDNPDPREETAQSSVKGRSTDTDIQNGEVKPTPAGGDGQDGDIEIAAEDTTDSVQKDSCEPQEMLDFEQIVFQGEWRQTVTLSHLVQAGLINNETASEIAEQVNERKKDPKDNDEEFIPEQIVRFVRGDEPVAGIIVTETGEKKSIFKSAKDGILRRGTAISLLEAQAATGNIIDPVTGRKMSVKDAAQLGLLDKVYETVLLRAERAVTGYKFRASDHILSLHEAMQKGLVVESHGLRLLEAQKATGGVIDHRINVRVPLDVAVERGLLDENLRRKLEDEDGEETKTFFDPNTEKNVTYSELMARSVVDNDTGLRLYPLERITKKRVNYGNYSGRSSLSSSRNASRSNSNENIPAAVAADS